MREALDAGEQAFAYLVAILFAMAGRLLAVASQRPRLGWALMWEFPVAVGMGVIGAGFADWLNLHGREASALVAGLAFLGPATLTTVMTAVIERGRGK